MAVTAGQTQTQQQIALQGQQVAQTAEGQTTVYQPVNGDGTIFQQGMITIPTASLAGAQIVHMEADTNTTSSGQGTVTVTLPVAGNVVSSGGMVMVRKLIFHFIVYSLFFHVSLSLKVSSACVLKSLMKLVYNPDLLRLRFLRHSGPLLQ